MSQAIIRLGPRHKKLVHTGFSLLWASGALWLVFHYFLRAEGDFGPAAHPLEIWWLRLHGLMAMTALILAGSLVPNHIRIAWNRRKNLASGVPMLVLAIWLAASGYALYYYSSDANAAWLPLVHWIAGLALPAVLVMHIQTGRRHQSHAARHPRQPTLRAVGSVHSPARKQASS